MQNYVGMFLRYALIAIAGLNGLFIFYTVFTPLTLGLLALLLGIFFNVAVNGNLIVLNNAIIEIIPACIAGSAYYLLFILVFATPNINPAKRIKILLFTMASFLVLNSLRILLLVSITGFSAFHSIHLFFWYAVSTVFVVGLWIGSVRVFGIKSVPFYGDIVSLYTALKHSKNAKKRRKNY